MNNNNSSLQRENYWILVIWAIVFMVILAWDQEKIVVLNLVIFCYFLRNVVGDSIRDAFTQRQNTLKDTLAADLSQKIKILHLLLDESYIYLVKYKTIILQLLKRVNNLAISAAIFSVYEIGGNTLPLNFKYIQLLLNSLAREVDIVSASQNLFVTTVVSFSPDMQVFEEGFNWAEGGE